MLDFTPFTLTHTGLTVAGLIGAYGSIAWLLNKSALLRPVPRTQIFYGGIVLVVVTVILALTAASGSTMMIGLLVAAFLTIIAGGADERHRLSPGEQLMWQVMIVGVAVVSGWRITEVTNPLADGVWVLPSVLLSIGVTIIWLLVLMNAMNWLDGSDGLASGVGAVAFVVLAAVALLPSIQDAQALGLALIGAGASAGFFLWNVSPARVYLGTIGSWWLGLFVGLAAVTGGGKVVTTMLLLAWPLADALAVIVQRIRAGQPIWKGDRERHLHFRLQARGYSPHVIAMGAMVCTALLGFASVALQTTSKIAALIIATAMVVGAAAWLASMANSKNP